MNRWETLERATDRVSIAGDWAEFGVSKGDSARVLHARLPASSRLWLFDWWRGLPEAWGPHPVGKYSSEIPRFDDPRVHLVEGRFEDTVAPWASEREPLAFVHVDCDLYRSTQVVLAAIRPLLRPGTVICLDEVHGYDYCVEHEGRAWDEAQIEAERVAMGPTQLAVVVRSTAHLLAG